MIQREVYPELKILLEEYPVVTVLGPRQAGKTTLVKEFLKGYEYSNLELPEVRELAQNDPKAYLMQFKGKVIIDEIQRIPQLLSYIQVMVDEDKVPGRFVLTGSHQLQLHESISQSLAGRTAILQLLPLSIQELAKNHINFEHFSTYCLHGFLPRVHAEGIRPSRAYSNYYQTYIERDVRQLVNIKNMFLFEKFLKLVAGRVGQIMEESSLAGDVGVDRKTIIHWLSILEASYILFKLPPYFENFGKRAIKSSKYYFIDVGLLSYILGIETEEQVERDPLVGSLFENLVVIECLKARFNQGKRGNLYFYRNNSMEVDLVVQQGSELIGIEIKSAATYSTELIKNLKKFKKLSSQVRDCYLTYNGGHFALSDGIQGIPFQQVASIIQ